MAEDQVKNHGVIVIGGSAGSLSMAMNILSVLSPSNLAVLVVFHRKPAEDGVLLNVLSSRTSFMIKEAEDKDILRPGVIFIAPPDYHVLVEKDWSLTLDYSEKVNFSRPSIDVTFESAAEACGDLLTCVLLSGANADGAEGVFKAKKWGARIIIQDPLCADVPVMPQAALNLVTPHALLTPDNIRDVFLARVNRAE